jgi:hypothetical protein
VQGRTQGTGIPLLNGESQDCQWPRRQSKRTSDDGQGKCSKHVEFYSKNKCKKLVHLVGFIISIYHDIRSPERKKYDKCIILRFKHIGVYSPWWWRLAAETCWWN